MPYNFDEIIDRRHTNSVKWGIYEDDILPAWVADMDFAVAPAIREALHAAVDHGIFGYDYPCNDLTTTVAARMEKLYGWKIDPKSVIAIPGIVSGFNAAAWTLCKPGEGYVIQPPVYMPFNHMQKNFGFIRQDAPLVKTSEGNRLAYTIDWDIFDKAFDADGSRTRMFLLCNPHNPSGQIYSHSEMTRMAETCFKHDTVIVSDEIHSELMLGGATFTPIATLSPEIEARTITLIAPSKTFNIPGLFCGFAIIPNPELRARYQQTVERATFHVNGMGLLGAQVAFSGACDDWLTELCAYLTANRDFVFDYVTETMPQIRATVPDATYLAWLDCAELKLGSPYKHFLEKGKVALNDGSAFGVGGQGLVRFNFGAPRALLQQALERMAGSLQ